MTLENEERRHVPQKDFYSVNDTAGLLQISVNTVYELASRRKDPLPFRRLMGRRRGMFITRNELSEWVKRNSALVALEKDMREMIHGEH
jgi:hypothetical protein